MRATILDLRRKMKDIFGALDRNEPVTILYHGKERAIMLPSKADRKNGMKFADHPAFGLWKEHEDKKDVAKHVRNLRTGRFNDF
ncbi:MAG: type II toxin-antitoxin system Phd/YefM family antitoxin [Candidatus Wallbacteria bacterium]|nr:type II toxin-antitoxin system Phd/YefM family antitoxin [Candidatus Wallbacteria bacterium]